jgi:multidrug transporter EmrE-like cation transporter
VKTTFLLVTMISCTVLANLLMKLGADDDPSRALLGLMSGRTFGGLAAFAFAGLFYAAALRFLPLNVAQSYAAAQFVAVILASQLLLGEPIVFERWIGISLISGGIIVVAATQNVR